MKSIVNLKSKLSGLYDAMSRYPLTVIFLIAATIVNANAINAEKTEYKYLLTYVVGAFLSFTAQAAYERFFEKLSHRIFLMIGCILLTSGYFLIVNQYTTTNLETWIRTSVALFALFIAFIWVPVIKSTITFNESFMTSFKAAFNSFLFSAVLFIGITLIITATDLLLFNVSEKAYMHTLNIVGVIFAPLYFLSLIPIYPGVYSKNLSGNLLEYNYEKLNKSSTCPRFLEILISYIVIPLLTIYTVILITYIVKNVTGKFWSDNRLEPMLVGFSITVILIYILASNIENKFTNIFRKVFPKILVPLVLFQIVSSVLRTQNIGITHGRYYVILFGIFAAISGIFLSIVPIRKNGIVAILLIGFSVFSILPPVDAFTISRSNQKKMLETVLNNNRMLIDNKVVPKDALSEEDKQIISNTVNYLSMMGYTKDLAYLGEDFKVYADFYNTFGFYRYDNNLFNQESIYISLNQQSPIIISGYDTMVVANFYFEKNRKIADEKVCDFTKNGEKYTISKSNILESGGIWLTNENGEELIRVNIKDVFNKFDTPLGENYQVIKESMTADQATFTLENEKATISLVAININILKSDVEQPYNGDFYVFVKIK